MTERTKENLIDEFDLMKSIEQSAVELYQDVYNDSRVRDENVKAVFKAVAEDEKRHVDAVDKILNIIRNSL